MAPKTLSMVYDIYFENKYNNKHKTLLYLNN
jgi:hypothetical protein